MIYVFIFLLNSIVLRVVLSISILIFLTSSIASSYISRELCLLEQVIKNCNVYRITVIRVILNDSLFVIFGVLLSIYLFRLARMANFNSIMKQHVRNCKFFVKGPPLTIYSYIYMFFLKGSSRCQAVVVTFFTSFLFITRTAYNIFAISVDKMKLPDFGYDWINVSDQADLVDLTEVKKYITFSVVLLIWEIIPTSAVVIIFRIKRAEVTDYNRNTDVVPRIVGKSVFSDNTHNSAAINYSFEDIPEERESLISESIRSNASSSSFDTYSGKYDSIRDSPPLNFINENYNFS
jgi:hypothetical protein